jgi:DNA-binding phage protein
MGKPVTSKKRKSSQKPSMTKESVRLPDWSPVREVILNPQMMSEGLAAALAEGDREAIIEILQGWIAALHSRFTMDQLEKITGVSRRALYNLNKPDSNPTLETLMGIVKAARSAA